MYDPFGTTDPSKLAALDPAFSTVVALNGAFDINDPMSPFGFGARQQMRNADIQ